MGRLPPRPLPQGATTGQSWLFLFGAPSSDHGQAVLTNSTTAWTKITATWTPGSTYTGTVRVGFWGNYNQSQANTVQIDDVQVWDTTTPTTNIPSISFYDADGHVVASVVPGGSAGDGPMVTRTGYDTLGRVTDITVDAVAGAGTGSADTNLNSHTGFDALGRQTDSIDPAGIDTHDAYNRLGQLTDAWLNYTNGAQVSSDTVDHDVHSTYEYDALGEMTGYCSAENLFKSGVITRCNPASSTDPFAWHYAYDHVGHMTSQTPPVNTGTGATPTDTMVWVYDGGGRLISVINQTATGTVNRHTDESYDGLGRLTLKAVYAGSGTASLKFSWIAAYNLFGSESSLAYVDATMASSDDTITFTYDSAGRPYQIQRGLTALTTYAYNADGTLHSRQDGSLVATTFTYDWAKRVAAITGTSVASGAVTYGYRLDGLLGTQSWPTGETATLSYDGAKRPTAASYTSAGAVSQTYDRAGDVTSDSRALAGVSGDAGSGTESFGYDDLHRVISWSGLTSPGESYTYDQDSSRLTKGQVGVTWTYTYNQNDQIVGQAAVGTTSGNQSFGYDIYGNMTTEGNNALSSTTYAYNLADQLTSITAASGSSSSFTYDALGRMRTEIEGGNTETFGYVATGQTAFAIVTTGSAPSTTNCLIGAGGERLATNTGGAVGWTIYDLHGDIVGAEATGPIIIAAFRYDPYGQTVAGWYSGSATVSTAWRYQGRLDVSPTSDPLYAAGARLYSPSTGTFTQMDTFAGSSSSPIGMNRYLYADADPATQVDPDGHCAMVNEEGDCFTGTRSQPTEYNSPIKTARKHAIIVHQYKSKMGTYLTDDNGAMIADIDSLSFGELYARCDGDYMDDPDPMCVAADKLVKQEQAQYKAERDYYCRSHANCLGDVFETVANVLDAISLGLLTGDAVAGPDAAAEEEASLLGTDTTMAAAVNEYGIRIDNTPFTAEELRLMSPADRGIAMEHQLLSKDGTMPPDFEGVDWSSDGTAIQLKSVDASLPSYAGGSGLASLGKGWVDDLADLKGDLTGQNGGYLDMGTVNTRILEAAVIVPDGGLSAAQSAAINEIVDYANINEVAIAANVQVVIIEVH